MENTTARKSAGGPLERKMSSKAPPFKPRKSKTLHLEGFREAKYPSRNRLHVLKDTCLFCKIIKREIPSKIVFEDDAIMAFEDKEKQAPVHILVVPKYHIEKLSDLTDEDASLIGKLVIVAKDIANEKAVQESGYRVVMNCNRDGGQDVFHLHLHLLGGRRLNWPPG